MWPDVLPGGRAVLFTILTGTADAEIALLDLDSGQHVTLIPRGTYPRYASTGHIVYGVDGVLHAVGFDLRQRRVTTNSVPVVPDVVTKSSGAADFDVARDGSLVYVPGSSQAIKRRLVFVDRDGREEPIEAPLRAYSHLRLSPDDTRVALDIRDRQYDISILDLARGTLTDLTDDPAIDRSPVWSPAGDRIVFSSERDGVGNLYWQPADGTGTAERLTESPNLQAPTSFTPDGSQLLFSEFRQDWDMMAVPMGDAVGAPRSLVATASIDFNGEVSPDGHWLAYESDVSGGREEIWVRPFPNVDADRTQVSVDGGNRPVWRADGSELFYFWRGAIMAVPVHAAQPGSSLEFGTPEVLFEGDYFTPNSGRTYDVTKDGQRFIMLKRAEERERSRQIITVLNWFEELKRLVPVR